MIMKALNVKKDEIKIRLPVKSGVLCYGKWWSRDLTAKMNGVSVGSMTVAGGAYSIAQQPMG